MIHSPWKDGNPDANLLVIRLASTDMDGFDSADINASYFWQYRNNLIGKHFKTLSQALIFHLHGIVPESVFELMNATGFLGAMLWISEIDDMEQYLVRAFLLCLAIATDEL
jgi:hypothetical protein